MKGIDVSDCQGLINWKAVKNAGCEFAILRTTRGSGNPDKYLPTNIQGCLQNGIRLGFYKYSYAKTQKAAVEEAESVIYCLEKYGIQPSQDTIIWMDVEDKCQFALSTDTLTKIIKAWKNVIIENGFSFGLYMGKYYYEHGEVNIAELNDLAWIARYYNGNTAMRLSQTPDIRYAPKALSGQTLWGWQYSSKGKCDGISGNVDLDVSFIDFKPAIVEPSYYKTPEFTIVDGLNKIGVDSSYANRKKIAEANGIEKYKGTAEQNKNLYELLVNGELKTV